MIDLTFDLTLFIISMALYSAGAFLDNYTTRIFIRDLGIEFEKNKRVRERIRKYGYKGVLPEEVIFVIGFGILDSINLRVDSINLRLLYSPFIFFGLIFLIVRGLTATDNLQKIVEYRMIGINAYKEKRESHRQAFQNISLMNMIKYILPYLVEALICFVIYAILLTVDFPFVILSRYFVLGLAFLFISTAYYSSKDC